VDMNATKMLNPVLFTAAILFANTVNAYDPGMVEEVCKKPEFRDLSIPVYSEPEKREIAPESTFTIMISPWAKADTIKLTAKNQPLNFTIESNSSFHRIKAKLPAAFNGMFVRLNVSATANFGCSDQNGWLVKVADK
jgi:hypothetical protein